MKQFLQMVAEGYYSRYPDIFKLTFVMPNKRSGSFLVKQLRDISERATVAPRIVSITDFVADVSENVMDSRLDLLFRLYDCYMKLPGSIKNLELEKFISWGDTVLSDFNEVDMQMVNPGELFKNVSDYNNLRSNFLTEEQKAVRAEYFGYNSELLDEDNGRLWKNFNEVVPDENGSLQQKFLALWQLLIPLYNGLKSSLHHDGLTTTGGAYREAAEKIQDGFEPYEGEKIVFVGFNALSESERSIFKALKGMKVDVGNGMEPKADFIWDPVSPFLEKEGDPAVRFISMNSRKENFPSPEWIKPIMQHAVPSRMPDIEVVAVPSNVMQVKVASETLSSLYRQKTQGESREERNNKTEQFNSWIRNARVAVILPDESLLLPLLYSLPEGYETINLTMGFPLKHTAAISFASLLKRLHRRSRMSGDEAGFFFEDIKDFLGHPYAFTLFPRFAIQKFIATCERKKFIMVSQTQLQDLAKNKDGEIIPATVERVNMVFRFLGEDRAPSEVINYIYEIYRLVRERLGGTGSYIRSDIEKTYIDSYIDALMRLAVCIKAYSPELSVSGVFLMADRVIGGESVAFEGEPLEGLQVMGVLETRCLDFDRIIMLSVNEKVMPRVGRNSTFIPNAIRIEFGMPPANYQEELFAYYFYRVLGRSENAILLYDSRTSNSRTAGPSRYLLQMKYLQKEGAVTETEARFGMPVSERHGMKIEKEGHVLEMLKQFEINVETDKKNTAKKFSPTALGHYFDCPVKFLYNDVLGIYVEREKIESIDAIDLGTIVHDTIEALYIRNKEDRGKMLKTPIVKTPEILRSLLNETNGRGEPLIESEVKKSIFNVHFDVWDEDRIKKENLRGSAAILLEYIAAYVRNIILADIKIAPFRIWGTEIKEEVPYKLPNGKIVMLKMVIDRLDQEGFEDPDAPFRVVDYKTGSVHVEAKSFDDIFNGEVSAKNIFQIVFYAKLLVKLVNDPEFKDISLPDRVDTEKFGRDLKLLIYNVPKILDKKGMQPLKIEGKLIDNMQGFGEGEERAGKTFKEELDTRIEEILNPEIPFCIENPDEETCRLCDYRLRCEMREAKGESTSAISS